MNDQEIYFDADKRQLLCQGAWDVSHYVFLKTKLAEIAWPKGGEITIDGQHVTKMDSSGAWLLEKLHIELEKSGLTVHFYHFSKKYLHLIGILNRTSQKGMTAPTVKTPPWIVRVGKNACVQLLELQQYMAFVGLLTYEFFRVSSEPKHWRLNTIINIIYRTGYLALPIIALLSFMVGVVLAYQLGLQLRNYGANVYVVDFLGISILREFGPLLTAVMVAGRTGSSFTAQLGIMKINQEIDALNTMGVTPAELLLIPRIIGLVISLPLLTMWSDIFGVLGGMIMTNDMFRIGPYDFLHRFQQVVRLKSFLLGIGKAPIFALIIASIGCFQGMRVEESAEDVGRKTTRSVVLSIFFILVADSILSVIFSKLKL